MATLNNERLKSQKRKRWKLFIVLTIFELTASVLLAYILHQLLLGIGTREMTRLDYSYVNALDFLRTASRGKALFGMLQLLYMLVCFYAFLSIRASISDVDTRWITTDISTPVPAGNGQHGNERFLTESEKEKLFQTFYFSGKETLQEKGGVVVEMRKNKEKEMILYVGEELHTLIIGASGAGKTRRVLFQTVWLQILSGLSIVVSDVKGEIYYFTHLFAEKLGYETIAFDLRNPKKSIHYNFLQPILDAFEEGDRAKAIDYTWDLVLVLAGEEKKGEPIWHHGETATIAAAILVVALDAPPEYRNLTNVYYFLAYMCETDVFGNMPLHAYLAKLDDTHPAKGVFAMARTAVEKTRSSFFVSALGTLKLFTSPNVAEMSSKSDFQLKDIGKKKTILYMMIPDEKKTLYPLVSILITQLYMQQVELANESGLRLPVDTDYDLDEVGNFPTIPCLGNILSAGRSRGVRANLIIQDFQQLESKYKNDFKNIKTNCQVKIYLKSDDPDTLKTVSENLGKYTVEVSSTSTSTTEGLQNKANYSSSASLTGRALLEPAEVKRIKSPYSICMVTGEYPGINLLPDLAEYRLNSIYGLGDKAYNTQLIMKREAQREEREISEPQLWGIWNEFESGNEAVEDRISFL